MAQYATLKASIQNVIKQNGNNEITGALLQSTLLSIVNSLGANYQYAGIATPETNPGTPDQNVFYFASTAGTYTNFNGIVVGADEICILKYNGTWVKDSFPAATKEQIDAVRMFIGMPFSNISWSGKKQNTDNIPTLISGQKYYLKINSVSPETRVGISVSYNGSDVEFIGNIPVGGNGIEIIPNGNKNQITAVIIDAESGSIDYSVSFAGIYQELDTRLLEAETDIEEISTEINGLSGSLSEYENENDTKVNTIAAQQDFVEIIKQTQAGADFVCDIPVLIPKGEIFLVRADWGDNLDLETVAIKLNNITSVETYVQNGVWSLIKPSVDVVNIHTDTYRTFVVSSGEFSIRIKKLQAITKDGKLPLYDGGLSANGNIFVNANRKTTRVILNDAPLYLYLSGDYQVSYYYGNEPDNLTDGGYITALNGGGDTTLNVDAKYIGFTIVKQSSGTFDDLTFIVANVDSNDAKLPRKIKNSILDVSLPMVMGSFLYPFVQGVRYSGIITSASNRITSNIVNFSGTIVIEHNIGDGLMFLPAYRGVGSDAWVEVSGWVTGKRFEYTGNGELYINVAKVIDADLTPNDAIGFTCFIKNTPSEIKNYPIYFMSVIGHDSTELYYQEHDIILRKNRRYRIEFSGVIETSAQSGELLSIGAYNVNNPEESISIAYRTYDNTTIPETRIIALPYDAFIRSYNRFSKNAYLDITIVEESTSVPTAIEQVVPDADITKNLLNNMKCRQFLDGDLITTVGDILVYGAGVDIDNEGNFCVGLMWAENAAGEYGSPEYNTGLILGNILDPYGTKQRYTCSLFGDIIVDGLAYDQISGETIAKKINDNEIAVFNAGFYLSGKTVAATRIFNLTTRTFGAFQKCYLNVVSGGVNYRFQIRMDETDMRQIHQLTGMHNWDDVAAIGGNHFGYYAGNNPIKIGEWFYVFMDIGNYAPALVRTQNFIDFYFVCELPFGTTINGTFVYNPTEEVALEYFNNRIYASCRGNKGRFGESVVEGVDYYGYNQIMSANFDDVLANNAQWQIVNLEPYWYEKPSMVAFNERIFLLTGGRGQWSYKGVEGKNLTRFKHMLFVFNRNLEITQKELLNPDDGWLHPTFQKYANSVYSVNHTDVRNYSYNGTGNNRSELRIKRLDMEILGM